MRSGRQRKGTATVELAVCLPLLVVLIFGGMEAANGIFLKQGLTVAAFETAKLATTVGFTAVEAEARGQAVLTARGYQGATITIDPAVTADMVSGETVTVTLTAPAGLNSVSPAIFHGSGMNVTATVVMNRN